MTKGKKLRLLRNERGITLSQAAAYFGRSKQWLDKMELGPDENISEDHIRRYAKILNVDPEKLYSIEEDDKLIITKKQVDDGAKGLDNVIEGRAVRKMLTLRTQDPNELPKQGFVLIPYLLDYDKHTSTRAHTHAPSLEIGLVSKGLVKLNVLKLKYLGDIGYLTEIEKYVKSAISLENSDIFDSLDLCEGDSYSLSSAIPHFTDNKSDSSATILVVRLAIEPWSYTVGGNRFLTAMPKGLPERQLIGITNTKSMRMLEAGLGWMPGRPSIQYHRHTWSEEIIYISEGTAKIKLSKSGKKDSNPPIVYELKAGSAIHMDGRLLHTIENASDTENVKYIVIHRADLNDYSDNFLRWEEKEAL